MGSLLRLVSCTLFAGSVSLVWGQSGDRIALVVGNSAYPKAPLINPRNDAQAMHFDKGPSNWARVFVAKPSQGLRGSDRVKAVSAFDTRLDARSRPDQSPYLAPNADDALFASIFMLVYEPQELSDFLGQGWVDTWIRESCRSSIEASRSGDDETAGFAAPSETDKRFSLAHVARYIAFLRVLARVASPPQIRFVDSVSRDLRVATSAVDLVLEFGASATTALLIERDGSIPADISQAMARAVPLRLRDLGCPITVHSGQIAATAEFDQQTFGNAALSRRSGRADAFQWTSLLRVGQEAQRLALRANATEGITGLSDLASQLANTKASETIWRFSTFENGAAARTAPMVTGETLRHLTEAGDVNPGADRLQIRDDSESAAPQAVPAVRPRFSQSSLVGLYIVELLLHAIGDVNAAGRGSPFGATSGGRADIRQIERVIVMSPLAMPAHERQTLIERAQGAMDLLWRTQGWDQPGLFAHPVKPQLSLGIGPDVGLQLVYLFNEVNGRLAGGFSGLVDCVRRRTGGHRLAQHRVDLDRQMRTMLLQRRDRQNDDRIPFRQVTQLIGAQFAPFGFRHRHHSLVFAASGHEIAADGSAEGPALSKFPG